MSGSVDAITIMKLGAEIQRLRRKLNEIREMSEEEQ